MVDASAEIEGLLLMNSLEEGPVSGRTDGPA